MKHFASPFAAAATQSPVPAPIAVIARDQSIECLRIIACFGIVAFHANAPFNEVAYAGVIAFLIIAPFVDLHYHLDRPRPASATIARFLLPWAFWACFYGTVAVALHYPWLGQGSALLGLLGGFSPHLWFLPFLCAAMLLLGTIKTRIAPATLFWSALLVAAALIATIGLWRPASLAWPAPFPAWAHGAPALFAGVGLGLADRVRHGRLIAAAVLAAALAVAAAALLPGVSITYPVGIAATAVAAWYGRHLIPAGWRVQSVASCMMGVYLTHIAWLMFFGHFIAGGGYLIVTLTFGAALLSVLLCRRYVPASRLVLG